MNFFCSHLLKLCRSRVNDTAVFGKENPAPLEAVNFDMTLLDKAAHLADELGSLYGEASSDRADFDEYKDLRDRAYTHLKEAVDEIRACGKFVCRGDEKRLKGYISRYRRRHRSSTNNNTGNPTENQE